MAAVRLSKLRRPDGSPIAVKAARVGHTDARFPPPSANTRVTSGTARNPQTGRHEAWLESSGAGGMNRARWTLRADGILRLDYGYALEGDVLFHGVTFDAPAITSFRRLAQGPYRAWKNRLRGTTLGVYETSRDLRRPGGPWDYPEFEGYYAGLRWASFATPGGAWTVTSGSSDLYLCVGTPPVGHANTTVPFPAGDVSFLHAVPAIGSKFVTPENTGPASQPSRASGLYNGTLFFQAGDARHPSR